MLAFDSRLESGDIEISLDRVAKERAFLHGNMLGRFIDCVMVSREDESQTLA